MKIPVRVRRTFVTILISASGKGIWKVCIVNVENVVNDPKKPIPKNMRHLGGTYPRYWELYIRMPIKRLPRTLTVRVPVAEAGCPEMMNLVIAPRNPPVPMARRPRPCSLNGLLFNQYNVHFTSFFATFYVLGDYNKTIGLGN